MRVGGQPWSAFDAKAETVDFSTSVDEAVLRAMQDVVIEWAEPFRNEKIPGRFTERQSVIVRFVSISSAPTPECASAPLGLLCFPDLSSNQNTVKSLLCTSPGAEIVQSAQSSISLQRCPVWEWARHVAFDALGIRLSHGHAAADALGLAKVSV